MMMDSHESLIRGVASGIIFTLGMAWIAWGQWHIGMRYPVGDFLTLEP